VKTDWTLVVLSSPFLVRIDPAEESFNTPVSEEFQGVRQMFLDKEIQVICVLPRGFKVAHVRSSGNFSNIFP
jgi:hypothetical protein